MPSWAVANVLAQHNVRTPTQSAGAVRNDPSTLVSFYPSPPAEDVELRSFEEFALSRLRVLKGIEYLKGQGKKEDDVSAGVVRLLEKHLKAEAGPAKTALCDQVSHFALRMAFCTTEDSRRWFVGLETELFRRRCKCLHGPEKAAFLQSAEVPYQPLSEADLRPHKDALADMCVLDRRVPRADTVTLANLADMEFYQLPFEQVPDLVASRKVYLWRGSAFVRGDQLVSYLSQLFRSRLERAMILTAGRWATSVAETESHRLVPIIKAIAARRVGLESQAGPLKDGAKISLADLPWLTRKHFPLCMQHLYHELMAERHLRHGGRMQLGLFLKQAGLSMEESMLFWRDAFAPRTSAEAFDKEYAYNIRHNYGREGGRKDYGGYNCLKAVSANPGVGDAHGCPFKTLQPDALRAAMARAGVSPMMANEAAGKAKEGHFQVACARVFEDLHGEAPDAGVTHPNAYLSEALEIQKRRQGPGNAAQATQPLASVQTPPAVRAGVQSAAGLPTPATSVVSSAAADGQTPFMRTPMQVTPAAGGGGSAARLVYGTPTSADINLTPTPAAGLVCPTTPVLGRGGREGEDK